MPLYRDDAVVLRTHALGEADRIVSLLTRSRGPVRAVAKGVRRSRSRFGARLEPFMVVDLQCYEGRNLDTVTQAQGLAAYGDAICRDYPAYTAATAMVETAGRLTDEREPATQQFLLLAGALRSLAARDHEPQLVLDAYLLRALAVGGWAPSLSDCARCGMAGPHVGFEVPAGGVVCAGCRTPATGVISPGVRELLSALLSGDWATAHAAGATDRRVAGRHVTDFLHWHLERGVRSLRLVERERV